jgi:hypothetical protein
LEFIADDFAVGTGLILLQEKYNDRESIQPAARANMVVDTAAFVIEEVFRLDIGAKVLGDLFVGTETDL